MHVPAPVLAATLLALLLLALAAGTLRANPAPPPAPNNGGDCTERLGRMGMIVERVATPASTHASAPASAQDAACAIAEPVRLVSVADDAAPGRRIAFPDRPLLACAMAERFARFAADIAAPLALGVYGKELVAVGSGPGHECRPRNRQAGAKMSSHGQGLAADIAVLELLKGRKVVVAAPQGAEDARFLAGLRAAACGVFNTVLGPGSDPAHADHVHVDIEPRGRDGKSKLCQ